MITIALIVTVFVVGLLFLGWVERLIGMDDGGLYGGERADREPVDLEAVPMLQAEARGDGSGRRADAHMPAVWRGDERRDTRPGGER